MIDFFYSDPHFGHKRICELAGRPFEDADAMNEALVEKYRELVDDQATTLWVGDCFFMAFEKSKALLEALPGRKLLVLGNHDRSGARMAEMGFDLVADGLMMRIANTRVRVSHYPYRYGAKDHRYAERHPEPVKGEVLIHGHTHSSQKTIGPMVHVGVDAWDYAPAPYAEVERRVEEITQTRKDGRL